MTTCQNVRLVKIETSIFFFKTYFNFILFLLDEEPVPPKTGCDTFKSVINITLRLIGVLLTLYVFIIALDLMSTGFRICLGLQISQLFRSEAILQSPITGLVIGVIVTVVVQSSSASTSIVVSLVASGSNETFSN